MSKTLSDNDVRVLNELLRWYNQNRGILGNLFRRNPRHIGSGTQVRRAITTAAAGAAQTIVCNLYDSSGIEQTTGDEAGITVYCIVTGSANLNEAIPALADDTDIFIVQLPYDNAGTVEQRWYCIQIFQSMGIC